MTKMMIAAKDAKVGDRLIREGIALTITEKHLTRPRKEPSLAEAILTTEDGTSFFFLKAREIEIDR
jgi:hypothetical protein